MHRRPSSCVPEFVNIDLEEVETDGEHVVMSFHLTWATRGRGR